jgi:hypothetical protein
MRATGLLLAAFALAVLLTACETTPDDRAFFQEGWRHPEQGAEKRMSSSPW